MGPQPFLRNLISRNPHGFHQTFSFTNPTNQTKTHFSYRGKIVSLQLKDMYHSYVGSFLSVRRNGSLSFSFSDQCCFLNDRFDRNLVPLSSLSCCACCANSVDRVQPISPSYLSGLRQSSLIQCSATRRLILGGGDRFYCRSPVRDVGRNCCCGHVCPLKERSLNGRRGRAGEGRFRRMVWEEKGENYSSSEVDDVEVILGLLTEEVGKECFGVRGRDCSSSRSVEVEKRDVGRGGTFSRKKKKLVGSGLHESKLRSEFASVRIESREEGYGQKENRRREDKESYLSSEKRRGRKSGSSCSSYYSCNSLGEFESDTEVHQEGHGEESGIEVKRDSKRSGVVNDGEIMEEVKWPGEKTAVGSYAASSGVECDWRKKSEKKLTEVLSEQTESKEKSSQERRRLLEVEETGYGQASSSHQQSDDMEEKSTSAMSIDDETRQRYSKKADSITGMSESRMKYKHITGVQEIHGSDIEAISSSEKHFSGRGENSSAAGHFVLETKHEHSKTAGYGSQKDDYRRNLQQVTESSEIKEINVSGPSISQRQSEARVKKLEDKSNVILGSVGDTKERRRISGQRDSSQRDSSGKFQQLTLISDDDTSSSLRQSDPRMKTQEDNSNVIFGSAEAKEQHSQTAQQAIRKMESRIGTEDMSNISVVHSTDAQVTNKQRTSEKRISSQETYSASVVKSTEETVARHNLTEGRVYQVGSKKEAQKPSKSLSFIEGTLKEAPGTLTSLILKTQPTLQHTGVDRGDQGRSQAIVTPPPSQLAARGPLHIEPTNDIAILEVSSTSLESGYDTRTGLNTQALQNETYEGARGSETHEQPLNLISQEDALGSVDRLQKSSMHFVGEFIEQVTQEASTSQVQKEGRTSEEELVNEGHKQHQKGLSGDFMSKEHDARQSSRSSGVKGPPDDLWDVTEPSTQETAMIEAPDRTTATTNIVAKKTGRSLWNVISDIVLLRWALRTESRNSAIKSGGRSSANQSASSEAWFSGQEPDKNSDENVKEEKKNMSQGATSADQEHLLQVHIGSQGEGSNLASSKDKSVHVGVEELSSSSRLESVSASQGNSSVSTEENFGRRGTAMAEPSVLMPSLLIRRSPSLDKASEAGTTDVSASGSLVQVQPIGTHLTEVTGSEGKDGKVKQRKLQRNNQVVKDRFDEWEEAYKLESEQRKIDEIFMREALLEAKKAADMWEVPVGAVLVRHGKIIARGCNLVEESRDSTAHAEMICIREASNQLRTWRLAETTLYVTLEPCPMCAGAILQARIDTVVWGAPNKLLGADGSWIRLFPNGGEGGNGSELTDKPPAPIHPFHPKIAIRRGVLGAECADEMQQFFQLRRRKERKKPDSPTPPSCLPISNRQSKFLTKMHDAFHIMFCL